MPQIMYASEDARQAALLGGRVGAPGSGRDRYAAAMYFFQRGLLSDRSLEVYRTCSVIDVEDPRGTLTVLGLLAEVDAIERSFGASGADRPQALPPAHPSAAAPKMGGTP